MEYALEAIKQGSAVVGLVSKTHAVVVALKRNAEELGSYQKKIIKVDNHLGVALAGLAPDARVLSNFLRQQAMSSQMVYKRPLAVSRAVYAIADKAQGNTQQYGRRPYGVGLLIIGHDEAGPHLYEFLPSGSALGTGELPLEPDRRPHERTWKRSLTRFPICRWRSSLLRVSTLCETR